MDVNTIVHTSDNVEKMDEAVEAADIPDQQNKNTVEGEVIPEKQVMILNICIQKQVLIMK